MRNRNASCNNNKLLIHNSLSLFNFKTWISLASSWHAQVLYNKATDLWKSYVSLSGFPNHVDLMGQLYNCYVTAFVYDSSTYHITCMFFFLLSKV